MKMAEQEPEERFEFRTDGVQLEYTMCWRSRTLDVCCAYGNEVGKKVGGQFTQDLADLTVNIVRILTQTTTEDVWKRYYYCGA